MTKPEDVLGHYKLMFPNDYLGAHNLKGRDVKVTIAAVKMEELMLQGGKKERKPVISFKGKDKKFVLNKTNAARIAKWHGTEVTGWVGKEITIYPTTTQVGKDPNVECLRVREKK